MPPITNDNEAPSLAVSERPDAHGQAAMLLVESLIHGLIAGSIINLGEAIDVVSVAQDVRTEMCAELGNIDDTGDRSLALLTAI